ncbi:hypothetical protein ABZX77_36815 [Streptomyces sp. NPDC004237]
MSSRMHFPYRAMSPKHTYGAWNRSAAELLISRVRALERPHVGHC